MCPLLSVLGSHVVGTHAGLAHVAAVSVNSSVSVMLCLEDRASLVSSTDPLAFAFLPSPHPQSSRSSQGRHLMEMSHIQLSVPRPLTLWMWVLCLYVCIHTMYVPDNPGNQRRALDSLEIELWMVVSHPVGSKDQLSHQSSSWFCYLLLKWIQIECYVEVKLWITENLC